MVLLEPVHAEDALEVGAPVAVLFKQSRTHVFSGLADLLPRLKLEIHIVLDSFARNLLVILIIEGKHTAEHQIGDDAERPLVDFLAIGLLKEDLGCDIRESAERIKARLVGSDNLGQAKIDDLEASIVAVVLHEDILGLQIAMCHTIRVEVEKGSGDLVA